MMRETSFEKSSLSLIGTIALGTGVMIGAGIFAITGQVAEFAGAYFPLAFVVAAVVSFFSSHSYVRAASTYPSSGGIAMILHRAYGHSTMTGASALLMALSMIINESLVARTFGNYVAQLMGGTDSPLLVPLLALGLVVFAFLVNLLGNSAISGVSKVTSILKIVGILAFAGAALWAAGFSFEAVTSAGEGPREFTSGGFLAGVALAVLAFKGFTTITNSGAEVVNPTKNMGRAIVISLLICVVVYLAVSWAVRASLSIPDLIAAKNWALAEAAKPLLGESGLVFTVIVAIIATASGLLASMFAVSRMLTMLTEMKLMPHRHFGMPGNLHKHLLVYTAVSAAALAAFFDLSRIASLGAIFYLVMDIAVHFGVLKYLRKEVGAKVWIIVTALLLDALALGAFVWMKWAVDRKIVIIAISAIVAVYILEVLYLRFQVKPASGHLEHDKDSHQHHHDHKEGEA